MNRQREQGRRPVPPPSRRKLPDEMLLSLCHACAQQFYNSTEHKIMRADYNQVVLDKCDYCTVRRGYNFIITERNR